jgi:hypothetical protein
MQGRTYTRKIRRRKSRVSCRWCGKQVLFSTEKNRRMRADRDHDLCDECWPKAVAIGARRAKHDVK